MKINPYKIHLKLMKEDFCLYTVERTLKAIRDGIKNREKNVDDVEKSKKR